MKKVARLFPLSLLILLAGGCSSNEPSPFTEVKEIDVLVPDVSSGYEAIKEGSLRCGFTSRYGNHEAYYNLDDVLEDVSEQLALSSPFSKREEGSLISYSGGKGYIVSFSIDEGNDSLTFPDYPSYVGLSTSHQGDFGLTSRMKRMSLVEGSEKYASGGETVFDLAYYDLEILRHEGDIYLPGAIANYIFLDAFGLSTIYNGIDLYRPLDSAYLFSGELTPYGEAYYSSPYKDVESKSEEIAYLHGNESMFYLDHFYGFKDDEEFAGEKVSSCLKKEYPDEMSLFYSPDKGAGEKAWDWLLCAYMDDLHSCPESGRGSLYDGHEFASEYNDTPRYGAYISRYLELLTLREKKLGFSEIVSSDQMLSFEGDIAVIRFDIFNRDEGVSTSGDVSYYEEHSYDDLYSQMAYSFMKIEEKGNIKKVVFDITANGGGYTEAALEAFSYLDEEVTSYLYHALNGSSSTMTYQGILPNGGRSYQDDYDFYVMTSLCTFSSANYFASLAKNAGIKVIGERSGGGSCMVGFFYTPEGEAARISSCIRMSPDGSKAHLEAGIAPDIELDDSYFYDLPKLSAKLDEASQQ